MSVAEIITDTAGHARDKLTNMFVSKTDKAEAAVAAVRGRIDANEANLTGADDEYTSLTARVAAGEQVDNVTDLLAGINQRRQFYRDLQPALQHELEKAERALLDAEDEAAAKKRRDFAKSNLKAFDQHAGEIRRCLAPVPELLQALHKAVTEAQDANEKAGELAGAEPVDIRSLLDNAIAAAALKDWL